MDTSAIGRMLLLMGGVFMLLGGALLLVGRIPGLGRLPGDILIERDGWTFSFPLITGIVLSIVLTIVLNVVLRLLHR